MRVLFLDPPVLIGRRPPERVFGCTYGLYPIPNIFLLQVAAVLKSRNHDVQYKNFPLDKKDKGFFVKFLEKDQSNIYCIYSVNLATQIDLEALRFIRKIKDDVLVIFFGPAPTYNPNAYLIDKNTVVVRGEPEITFCELIEAFKNKEELSAVKGVSFLKDGSIVNTPARELNIDLDNLPFPARELIDSEKYFNPKFGKEKFTAMITSRGCPYRCKFCVPSSLSFAREIEYKNTNSNKPPYISRGAENVINEFKFLKEQGYTAISILDDEFVIDKKRVINICQRIKKLNIIWGCLSRADSLNEGVVKEMSEAGCKYIDIGVESFCQEILDDIKKNLKVETIETAIKLTKKYKIFTKVNIMFGSSKLENKKTIRKTLEEINKTAPDAVMFSICNPFPGTEYYYLAKEKGWFVNGDYYPKDVQKESTITLPNISKIQLERAVRKANLSFYLRPYFVIKNLLNIRSFNEFFNKISVLKKKLF